VIDIHAENKRLREECAALAFLADLSLRTATTKPCDKGAVVDVI
jgi:hypothetical protein